MKKSFMPDSVFDGRRFLQTVLQTLHETLGRAGWIARSEKRLILGPFPHASSPGEDDADVAGF